MSNSDKAGSGERFKAPAAQTWNRMVDAANAFAEGRVARPKADPAQPLPTDLIKVKNGTCGNRRKGEVVKICDKAIKNITEEYKWLSGATTDGRGCFAILKTEATRDQVVQAQVSGVCLALVVVNNESHNRAQLVAGEVVMRSATSGPCEIIQKDPGLGERLCVVVIHESCATQAATAAPIPDSTNCQGSCQWSWVGGQWSQVSNGCTPTTTTGEPTTTTTGGATSSTTTTTTAEPSDRCGCPTTTTTTTTADHCQCLRPIFCGETEGECTFTSCSKEVNPLPDCTTTTSTTSTTTTACDCNTTTTPSGDGNCVWYKDSAGVLRCANCPPGCLPPPVELGECDVFVSPPVPPIVSVTPPCVDGCEGGSIWKCVPGAGWLPEAGSGGYTACSRKCTDNSDGTCFSPPPSIPCEVCGTIYEPCVYVPIGTTTTGEPTTTTTSVYDTACGICYGSTSTSTTTTAQCEGNCRLKWSGSAWSVQKKTCAASCGCLTPGIDGELPCHVIEVPCTPTTTTTTSTTTTTTTSPWSCCGPSFASCGVPGATYCVSGTTCPGGQYKCSGGDNFADCAGYCGDTTTSSTTTTAGPTENICCDFGSPGSPNCSCFTVPLGATCSSQYGVSNCVPDSPFTGDCATCITPTTTTTTSTSTTTSGEPTTTTTCEACTGLTLGKLYWQCKPGTGLGGISGWQLVYNAGGSSLCAEGWTEPGGPCDTDCQCISCDETTPTS